MSTYRKLVPNPNLGDTGTPMITAEMSSINADVNGQNQARELIGYKMTCDDDFTCTMEVANTTGERAGTVAFQIVYKNAIGTLTLQESVDGVNFADIVIGTTTAEITMADSSTVQSQIINLSVGAFAGAYIRCNFVASGAGTGYIKINVI